MPLTERQLRQLQKDLVSDEAFRKHLEFEERLQNGLTLARSRIWLRHDRVARYKLAKHQISSLKESIGSLLHEEYHHLDDGETKEYLANLIKKIEPLILDKNNEEQDCNSE